MARRGIEWEAHEIDFKPRSGDWFWAVGIIGLAMAIAAAFFKNFLFSIFIVLASFAIMLNGSRPARKLIIKVTSQGVRVNKELYPYNYLKAFWIDEETPEQHWLILHPKKSIFTYIKLPIVDVDTEDMRDFLLDYLEEEHHEPGFADNVADYFGF